MRQPRVLIAGAGLAGLALTRALTVRGISPDVVERSDDWQTSGAGLYLPANAVRALDELGVGSELSKRSHLVKVQRLLDSRGRLLSAIDTSMTWGDVGDSRAISRNGLHEVLRSVIDGSLVRFGLPVTAVDPAGTVTFGDGSSAQYDLVVGADGINSAVRGSAFAGSGERRFLGQLCWRFIAPDGPATEGITDWTARLGDNGRTFLTVRLGDGGVYCYADINSVQAVVPPGDWRTLYSDFGEPVQQLLEHGADAHFSPLWELAGTKWAGPRVVLIGDAAHACSPSMAQGGAMALEDALVLAELISAEPVETAVAAFVARRGPRMQWVLEQNHRRDRARNLPTPVRNLILRFLGERLYKTGHAPLQALP